MDNDVLLPGDPAPNFVVRSTNSLNYHFDTVAGRYIVLCFFGSAGNSENFQVVKHILSHRNYFDDNRVCFFGVSIDPKDEAKQLVQQSLPGIRFFWDFDQAVSKLYGALEKDITAANGVASYQGFTLVLDPMLRVLANIPLSNPEEHNQAFDSVLSHLPSVDAHAGTPLHAPVLILPRVFEPNFCKHLIDVYEKRGGNESGFMNQVDGNTVVVLDNGFKRRKDFVFNVEPEFEGLRTAIRSRIDRRIVPEIQKAFQFKATRIERYMVSCYDSESKGFFRPHRDNTTLGTAHRRFACTINLNAEEYEGGDLRFPEFGSRTYRAPTGGAVVFSCSLQHEATPVTKGRRYCVLPFFYDDAAAEIRKKNERALTGEVINRNKEYDA